MRLGAVTLRVRVKPGSSRSGPIRADPDAILIGLHSPPEKGRANDELVRIVARMAGVPPSSVTILRGTTSRQKLVQVASSNPAGVGAAILASVRAL
jgi:uncharacterized protein